MEQRNILSWNITNWLTVILMVAVGYVLIGGIISIGRQWAGGDMMDGTAAASATDSV